MRGNPHVRFGPEAAGKGPAPCRHLAGVLPVPASTPTSARSSSSSAPTSPTTPSCASTATNGPNARPPRPASGSPHWTTGSPPSMIRRRCRRSATGSGPDADRRAAAQVAGHPAAPVHRRATGPPATATSCRSCRPSSPSPRCSTNRCRVGCSSSRSSATTSTSAAPTRSPSSSTAADPSRAARDPGTVPHPGDHRGRHPQPARRLQAHPHQAVPQGREGVTHRNHHQRHPRLRDRETADQSARAARDRLLRQPTPAARPTTRPRPDHRHRRPAHHHRPPHHRHRRPRTRVCGWPTGAATPCCRHC